MIYSILLHCFCSHHSQVLCPTFTKLRVSSHECNPPAFSGGSISKRILFLCFRFGEVEHLVDFLKTISRKDVIVDKQSQILETKTILSKHGQTSQQALPGGSGRENIRVQMCISAIGKLIPPLLSIKENNVAYF